MRPGAVIAGRFRVERMAGRGGNGAVYRAHDEKTGEPVALKIALWSTDEDASRFGREAQVLAELRHPGIVRYLAHGTTEAGNQFLAMEWIEGEDLSVRLAFRKLRVDDAVELMRRIADALGSAHRKGVVHRDIKPGNILLVDKELSKVKLVDFGLARRGGAMQSVTRSGIAVGTPGYMAPEQARGMTQIDARADVFAMGCVFYQCLTGLPPFFSDQTTAVLAKIVIETAPPIRHLCDDVPEALDDLVARMMAKDRQARPTDALDVAAELAALGTFDGVAKARVAFRAPRLTGTEQRLSSVVLASASAELPTLADKQRLLEQVSDSFGGRLDRLADGSVLVSFARGGTPTERAINAARSALAIREILPDAVIALATGWDEKAMAAASRAAHPPRSPGGAPVVAPNGADPSEAQIEPDATTQRRAAVGEIIDRAARILTQHPSSSDKPFPRAPTRALAPIAVDETAAGLLRTRFDVEATPAGFVVWGERDPIDAPKTLLGRATECVGRDLELRRLELTFDTVVSSPTPRAIVITGAPGIGKSRLCQEFVRRLRESGKPHQVWTARGDPLASAGAFGLVAQALVRESGLLDGEALEERQRKLRARVARRLRTAHLAGATFGADDIERIAQFFGELVGVPFPEDESTEIRAAHRDTSMLGIQVQRAWEDFLLAECAAEPVVLVLEDLQWGDRPSLNLVDAALRNLSRSPLFVIATGRPELFECHPVLWAERGVGRLELGELGRDASERLVRQALVPPPPAEVVARIVDRAEGHAFYLEELIRAVAEGRGEALPQTVVAMVQARLERLTPAARRVLRAASVFGPAFWKQGVSSLVGAGHDCDAILLELEARELIVRRVQARFPTEEEYGFRNEAVREAAYAMLTDSDRMLGHHMAAAWLERAGETNTLVLAEHFERGGDRPRALPFYVRAAEQALGGNDLETVLALVDKAVASGAAGEQLGALRQLEAAARFWRGELAEAEKNGLEAMRLFTRGTDRWCHAAADLTVASSKLGNVDRMLALVEALRVQDRKLASHGKTTVAMEIALARAAQQLLLAGRYDEAHGLVVRLDTGVPTPARDPSVLAHLAWAMAVQALVAGELDAHLRHVETAVASFGRAGDVRSACTLLVTTGYAHLDRGAYLEAERVLLEALGIAERMGLPNVSAAAKHKLGLVLARQERLVEARQWEEQAIEAARAQGDRRLEGASRVYMARILMLARELEAAEREVRNALTTLDTWPPVRALALAALADVLLRRAATRAELASRAARISEALAVAQEGAGLLGTLGGTVEGESYVLLMRAESLAVAENRDAARAAIAEAHQHLLRRGRMITDRRVREAFFSEVPENARTLVLAAAWLTDP